MMPFLNTLLGGGIMPSQMNQMPQAPVMTPFQKIGIAMQAMQNPAAFAKRAIPDLPDNIANNPQQILNYLQQTRGVTNEQIQMLTGQYPMPGNGWK